MLARVMKDSEAERLRRRRAARNCLYCQFFVLEWSMCKRARFCVEKKI